MLIKFRSGFLNPELVSEIGRIISMRSKVSNDKTGHLDGEIYELKYTLYMSNGHGLSYEIPVHSQASLDYDDINYNDYLRERKDKIKDHYANTIFNINNQVDDY